MEESIEGVPPVTSSTSRKDEGDQPNSKFIRGNPFRQKNHATYLAAITHFNKALDEIRVASRITQTSLPRWSRQLIKVSTQLVQLGSYGEMNELFSMLLPIISYQLIQCMNAVGRVSIGNAIPFSLQVSSTSRSLFAALTEGIHPVSGSQRKLLARRAVLNASRTSSASKIERYRPYTTKLDPQVKLRLLEIAKSFQFLDQGFAEYFHVVMPYFGKDYIQSLLLECRMTLSKAQNQDHDSIDVELGDLGHFCEESIQTWKSPHMQAPKFSTTYQQYEEIMHYLQDALEAPYWEFMIDIFIKWRSTNKSLSGEVVLRVLQSTRLDVNHEWRLLLDEIKSSELDRQDLEFILEGIETRMKIIESICCYSTESNSKSSRLLESCLQDSRRPLRAITESTQSHGHPQPNDHQKETVTLIAFVMLFLMAAIPSGYKGFSLSMQDDTTGSINDADFWYLVQNSVMAVLGNIVMVVPLLKESRFSPAYSLMWLFFTLGLGFAGVAVAIYPFLNTGWSSMVSFFGSISSIASVLVMTQAVAKEARDGKIETKSD